MQLKGSYQIKLLSIYILNIKKIINLKKQRLKKDIFVVIAVINIPIVQMNVACYY